MNLSEAFSRIALKAPQREAVVDGKERLSYADLHRLAGACAAALDPYALRPGERIVLALPNGSLFIAWLLAAWSRGLIAVPVNPLYKRRELVFILTKTRAPLVVAEPHNAHAAAACEKTGVRLHPADRTGDPEELRLTAECEDALIIFTHAVDGRPKGAVLTHANLWSNASACREAAGTGENDAVLGALPFYHAFGITTCLMMPLLCGGKVVAVPKFTPDLVLDLVVREKITFYTAVPTMLAALCMGKEEGQPHFRTCPLVISGGAPLRADVYERFLQIYDKPILQGYGLTEAGPVVSLNPQEGRHKPLSIGLPLPRTEVKIVEGEVVIRSPSVMRGYWEEPAWTRRVLTNEGLHTGDEGYIDEDGFIYLTGLRKPMLIMGGFNVYFEEVRQVLEEHPAVVSARLYAQDDFLYGQVPAAQIVAREEVTERDLVRFLREELANYKVPRKMEIRRE